MPQAGRFMRAGVPERDDAACSLLGRAAGARDAGKLRLEGKDYPVKDGDVLHFRFNV